MLLLSGAPQLKRLPAADLECRRPTRIRYSGTDGLGRAGDMESCAALKAIT
jgi:hypothetical protein